MALLDGISDWEGDLNLNLDFSKAVDGAKWRTVFDAEKTAYMQRAGIESLEDDMYIFQCLIDWLKVYKKEEANRAALEAARQELAQRQQLIASEIETIKIQRKP